MAYDKKKYLSYDDALMKLQRYCAYQDRCHKEVRTKLLQLGVYGDDLEAIIADLVNDNFLNEERFARSYARGKFRSKGWGRNRILRELKLRNISEYCIRKGLSEIEEEDYRVKLRQVLEKYAERYVDLNDFERKQKLITYGIRRGYEFELVRATAADLIQEK